MISCHSTDYAFNLSYNLVSNRKKMTGGWYVSNRIFLEKFTIFFVFLLLIAGSPGYAQMKGIDKKEFFTGEQVIQMTLEADFKKLIREKLKKDYRRNFIPATITCIFPDSSKVTDAIEIRPRGQFRREECNMPPLMVNFKTPSAAIFNKLGRLKLVWPCGIKTTEEQLVLKEYLVYKIYNLLTEKSFRVRLVKMGYRDNNKKMKRQQLYAFFIEDVDDMARRNKCEEIDSVIFRTEATNRQQATMVGLFEYFIGNTDWAIPLYRNVKLMRLKSDSASLPFVVPYDFDYCGMVNAPYAIPPPMLSITSVTQRLYRGFPRTLNELAASLQIFRRQRQAMNSLIMNFEPLSKQNKKEMIQYLDDFYETTKREKDIRDIFITNARTE